MLNALSSEILLDNVCAIRESSINIASLVVAGAQNV